MKKKKVLIVIAFALIIGFSIYFITVQFKQYKVISKYDSKIPGLIEEFNLAENDIDLLRTGELTQIPILYSSSPDHNGEMMLTVYSISDSEPRVILDKTNYNLNDPELLELLPQDEIDALIRLTSGETGNYFAISTYDGSNQHYIECISSIGTENAKITSLPQKEGQSGDTYVRRINDTYFLVIYEPDKYQLF